MAIEDLKNKANEKVNEIKEKAEEIKKDLDNFKEKILSKEEREKKLNELKEKVQKAREELKEKADTLKDSATEKVQATLDSLNEQINLSLAILKNTRGEEGEEDEKKGFFKGIGDWFSEKWNSFKEKDTKGKAVTVGAGLAGIGLIAWRAKGREKRKADREAKKAEREAKREERRQKRKERWGKILKRLGGGALLAGLGYAVKRGVDKKKENEDIEEKIGDLRGFDSECKELKEKADDCLEKSRLLNVNHKENQKEYERILADALSMQKDAIEMSAEISASKAKNEVKTEAKNLKDSIDGYVEAIKAMRPKIYELMPEAYDEDDGEAPTETATEAPTETATETPTETATETPTEAPTERERKTPESELGKLRGFESECKDLKEKADKCLDVARSGSGVINYIGNQEKYEEILANMLSLQTDATSVVDEMSRFRLRRRIKTEMEDLKKRIDDYVEEVKVMKSEIYAPTETPSNPSESGFPIRGGGGLWYPGGGSTPETPTETEPETPTETAPETPTETTPETTPETFEPVSAAVLTKASIDYLEVVKKEHLPEIKVLDKFWNKILAKAKNIFEDYYKEHPILRKSASNKMVFEINDPTSFSDMLKKVYDKSVPDIVKGAISLVSSDFSDKVNNISKTLKESDVKTYKDIAFPGFGTLIQNAVKAERGTMTVQTYYDGFSRAFPNRHDSQIARDLASSGQADKDIKVAELSSIS